MKQIAIISGKGGTGKTSITSAFASLTNNAVFADCDVAAADLHLIFKPEIKETFDFQGATKVSIEQEDCIRCGLCFNLCRFDAIDRIRNQYYVREFSCEACDLCRKACPVSAINKIDKKAGDYFISDSRFGPMVHSQLEIGEELSGKLVALIRDNAQEIGKAENKDFLIIDGPPGIGYTAIATITGVDIALLISEPTQSGLHDLKRSIQLLDKYDIPAVVIVNKWDLNPEMTKMIEEYCKTEDIKILSKIPYSRKFTHAMIEQKTIIEFAPDCESSVLLKKAWKELVSMI